MTDTPSIQDAIDQALASNWKEAIKINSLIIKKDKQNIDAHNRLGFAYLKTGMLTQAKNSFQKVIKLDKYNQIALKNLKRLTSVKRKDILKSDKITISPLSFLEDPGRTKVVVCVHPAPSSVLMSMSAGQQVYLKPKNHCIELRDANNIYLGALPDDLTFRLLKLISAGNLYQAVIKSTAKNNLTIILREIQRGKKFTHQPSFVSATSYVPYQRTDNVSGEKPNVTATGEEDDHDESNSNQMPQE